ncbi:hypothetical protein [Nonomuraea sp. SYSU D8015]|uniref:hypothetical protein n=1 Tax=Nonomuraea sp. SYSU D8015 TaxID=2593644 RepID=UPI0016615B4B|nr:hypothetical protein [Nonomuraea sp. SYSU D8015]
MDEKAAVEEAVKSRLSLIRYFGDDKAGLRMMLSVMLLTDMTGRPLGPISPAQLRTANGLRLLNRDELVSGPTFVAPKDVCQLIEQTWESYPSKTAYATDILAPTGFLYFEEPLPDPMPPTDPDELPMPVAAMSWIVIPADDERIPFYDDAHLPGAHMLMLLIYTRISDLNGPPDANPRVFPIASCVWTIGDKGSMELWKEGLDPDFAKKREWSPYVQIFLVWWRIIAQELLEVVEPKERDKKTRTRLQSARRIHPNLNGKTQVTRFRMQTGSGDQTKETRSPSGREYTVRFYRRPYWRWQYFPSTGENKPKLIITKKLIGPEGAPIVGGERVFLPPKPLGQKPERKQ